MYLTTSAPALGETKTETGEVVAINQFVTFIIGAGNFGGKRSSDTIIVCVLFLVVSFATANHRLAELIEHHGAESAWLLQG